MEDRPRDYFRLRQYRPGKWVLVGAKTGKYLGKTTHQRLSAFFGEAAIRATAVSEETIARIRGTIMGIVVCVMLGGCIFLLWAKIDHMDDFGRDLLLNLGAELLGAALTFLAFGFLWEKLKEAEDYHISEIRKMGTIPDRPLEDILTEYGLHEPAQQSQNSANCHYQERT